ncbi:hypothetical protein IMSHALPRED_008918 [Imshaugia aleurites]|uniref:Uncharacterized protein n=1 Tax=Imshaugia aleurites TaxID=172621 RepID=A0A8H3G3N2_9LECA|nr:hypothetical protein IMSHALPRED_008918 [Imshaugia aleurites]
MILALRLARRLRLRITQLNSALPYASQRSGAQLELTTTLLGYPATSSPKKDGYPKDSIIFCVKVDNKVRGEDYYPRDGQPDTSEYRSRIDRIYSHNEASRRYSIIRNQTGHTEANMPKDIGEYSSRKENSYKNSWVLLSSSPNFRYFGKNAHKIPGACPGLLKDAQRMRQWHRVYKETDPEWHELKDLVDELFQRETLYTQAALPKKRPRCSSGTREGDGKEEEEEEEEEEDNEEGTGISGVVKRARNRC